MKKTTYIVISLFAYLFFTISSCAKISYIQPFKWGKISELYKPVNGKVKEIADSCFDLLYLAQSDEIFTDISSGKLILKISAYENEYPKEIYRKLSERVFVRYKINEQQEFEKVTITIDGVDYDGILSFPSEKSYKIRSAGSTQNVVINIIEETFNEDYSIKTRTIWDDRTQIGTTEIYDTILPPNIRETFAKQKREIITDGALVAIDTLRYDQNGNLTSITRIEQKNNAQKITTYLFENQDNRGNYLNWDTFDLGIPKKRSLRKITYYP